MPKRNLITITICLGVLASCDMTEEFAQVNPDDVTFYASNGDNVSTRTIILDNGAIEWLPKDEITLFYGDNNSVKLVSSNEKQAGSVEFKGTIPGFSFLEDAPFWAVYPYRLGSSR